MKKLLLLGTVLCSAVLVSSCALLDMAANVGEGSGLVNPATAKGIRSAGKVADAGIKATEKPTPRNEYYVGRTVAATLLARYKPYENPAAVQYINTLGQTLAALSDKPETFGGYHFIIMDTDEINAFAAPGGLILISRGLIRCCKTEDALAGVLAHEVGHIQLEHAMKQISSSRWIDVVKVMGTETFSNLAGDKLGQVTEIFGGTINDVVNGVSKGYMSYMEYDADKAGVTIMTRAGYNGNALKEMIDEVGKKAPKGSAGFGKTHPTAEDRIKELKPFLTGLPAVNEPAERHARFAAAMKGI